MRKIRIMEHISLDGVIQPGGPGEYGDDYMIQQAELASRIGDRYF